MAQCMTANPLISNAYTTTQTCVFSGNYIGRCFSNCVDPDILYDEVFVIAPTAPGATRIQVFGVSRWVGVQIFSANCDTMLAQMCISGIPADNMDFLNTTGIISVWFTSEYLDTITWRLSTHPAGTNLNLPCVNEVAVVPPLDPAKPLYWDLQKGILTDQLTPNGAFRRLK